MCPQDGSLSIFHALRFLRSASNIVSSYVLRSALSGRRKCRTGARRVMRVCGITRHCWRIRESEEHRECKNAIIVVVHVHHRHPATSCSHHTCLRICMMRSSPLVFVRGVARPVRLLCLPRCCARRVTVVIQRP